MALGGEWRIHLGPFEGTPAGGWPDRIRLPGTTDEAGYGAETRGAELGYLTRAWKYIGPACYRREIEIPAEWAGRSVSLFLERCLWRSRVWIDGRPVGGRDSLTTPHEYELGRLDPGRHELTVEVDNSPAAMIGLYGHSYTEHTQSIWNGIVGRIELRARGPAWIERLRIDPDAAGRRVRVSCRLRRDEGAGSSGRLRLRVREPGGGPALAEEALEVDLSGAGAAALSLGDAVRLWDEFSPALYELEAALTGAGGEVFDRRTERFGFRELATREGRITLNGRPLMLRGTLECCIFPRTGYPPTDAESWRRLIAKARDYGLNHLRFHSWCPPEAAFQAADEAGFLLQVETPLWIDKWMGERTILETEKLPEKLPKPFGEDPEAVRFIQAELRRILETYGNHPSFAILCVGNEIYGDYELLGRMIREAKQRDPRRLYACSTARRHMPQDDVYVTHATPKGRVRGILGEGTAQDFREAARAASVPVISHEIGQWVTHPDYSELPKYTGPLRPRSLALYRRRLEEHGLLEQVKELQRASGRFAWKLYKEEIEAAMRTPLAGFQLLQLHDYPGQGEALVGLLDSFWDSKGILEPEEMRRFCSATVPLLRLEKLVWQGGEHLEAPAEAGHYGPSDIPDAVVDWKITDAHGQVAVAGALPARTLPSGGLTPVGVVRFGLPDVALAGRWKIELSIRGTEAANDWDFWVFPRRSQRDPDGIVVTRNLEAAREALQAGRRVLLTFAGSREGRRVRRMRFLPVFWSFAMFRNQPGLLGLLCRNDHPALAGFPTEEHCDWQWRELMESGRCVVLNDTPPEFRPIVQPIDDFHRADKLGAVFEAKVGDGRLIACGFDIETDLDRRIEARQLRHSLLGYMNSPAFRPGAEMDMEMLARLFA